MVLSVLFSAGAVPLSIDDQIYPTASTGPVPITSTGHPQPSNPEYVHFLEELVGELSGVFATWVHQNPPPSSPTSLIDMYHQRTNNTCRSSPSSGLLPDVIPHHYSSDKWNNCSSPTSPEDLRMRRGLAPMRFRLDSVGSSVPSATSSAVSTPTSAASFFSSSAAASPMPFDLLPSPTTSSSTVSFFADYPPLLSSDISERTADLDTTLPVDATDASPSVDASIADWRQVGRDLRGIADNFASTRRSQSSATGCQQWSLLSAALCSPLASAGPLVSALAVYLWWKLVRRLTA